MMSNQAQGFNHITFNTTRPMKTAIGNFEWQLVTAFGGGFSWGSIYFKWSYNNN